MGRAGMNSQVLRETREITIDAADGERVTFRLKVFEHAAPAGHEPRYRMRVWTYELVRMFAPGRKPGPGDGFDAEVLVVSDAFDGMECSVADASAAAEIFLGRMLNHLR